jgi:hypothetical protein
MKTLSSCAPHFAAFIGLDWSDQKHDICLQVAGKSQRETLLLKHSPEAIHEWACELRKRFEGRPVAIALELSKGPIVYALRKYNFIVLFPVNPITLAKYREVFTHSGAKDDPTDAQLALELLLRYPDKLQQLNPQSPQMRALEQLVEMRRRLVDDQTRITNRITSALKSYFPQPLQWFPTKDSILFCDFLQRWPTLKSLRQARRTTLERFLHEHNVRQVRLIEQRIQAMRNAVALTNDEAVIQPSALLVKVLVTQLRATLQAIETFDHEISKRAPAHPDFAIFESFPAAGPVFAPRLLTAFGEQARALPPSRRSATLRRRRSRHRTKWSLMLGALALGMPHLPAANLCRMDGTDHPSLPLGSCILSKAAQRWEIPPSLLARARIQVDPHPAPLLDDTAAL